MVVSDLTQDPLSIILYEVKAESTKESFDFQKGDYLSLYKDVRELDRRKVYEAANIDQAVKALDNYLSQSNKRNIPFKTSRRRKFSSWFSQWLI